jgi:hypothetical protein
MQDEKYMHRAFRRTISDMPGIEGVEIALGLNKNYISSFGENKIGVVETTFTHSADGNGHKNRMQGSDFVTSIIMDTHGVRSSPWRVAQ